MTGRPALDADPQLRTLPDAAAPYTETPTKIRPSGPRGSPPVSSHTETTRFWYRRLPVLGDARRSRFATPDFASCWDAVVMPVRRSSGAKGLAAMYGGGAPAIAA